MFLVEFVLAALAFSIFVDGSVLSPNENQYRRRIGEKGGGQPQVEMSRFHDKDATDRELIPSKYSDEDAQGKTIQIDGDDKNRTKRSYYPYPTNSYHIPSYQSISAWRPSFYPIQRPYFVPIYGFDGRVPIYLPAQPWYINPGTPPKNPAKPPFVGPTYLPPVPPTYLPPVTQTPPSNQTTTMGTDDRFGGGDDDDRPIWDGMDQTTRPSSMVPTRKPPQGRPNTYPPLVHNGGGGSGSSNGNRRPLTTAAPEQQLPGPSRCVWAIVSCCSTSSDSVSYKCFEQLGCAGPFWDASPCDSEYAKAAIQAALNFYNSKS